MKRLTWILLPALAACTLDNSADAPFGSDTDKATSASGSDASTTGAEPATSTGAVEVDVVAEVCHQLDACGFLPAGIRVGDCHDTTASCLEDGLQSEVSDWELVATQCLQFQNCFNFIECYESLQTCELDDVGTGGLESSTGGLSGGASTGELPDDTTTGSDATTGTEDPTDDSTGEEPPICGGNCDECLDCAMAGPCYAETVDCNDNDACLELADCYTACNQQGAAGACYAQCQSTYPDGVVDYQVLSDCAFGICTVC